MTGVIICVDPNVPIALAVELRHELSKRFPGVEFAVVPATHALAFDFDTTTTTQTGGTDGAQGEVTEADDPHH